MATQILEATPVPTDLSFGIRVPSNNPQNPSRQPFIMNSRFRPAVISSFTDTVIPSVACMNQMVVVNATGAGTRYLIPPAANLLAEFGRNLDSGLSKAATGDILRLQIVNIGAGPAYILATGLLNGVQYGGDGTCLVCPNGGGAMAATAATGSTVGGNITNCYIRFTNVGSSMQGTTGSYTLFPGVF